jgi:hypothetical protein
MATRFYPKAVPLAIPAQIARMRDLYPGIQKTSWQLGVIVWEGGLRPTDVSENYRIRISYRLRKAPRAYVLEPVLSRNEKGEKIPHRYADGSLCLYYPEYDEWSPKMFIAETIVPWTALWLYHYEVWHATNQWLGGGIEHSGLKRAEVSEVLQ